MYHLDICHLYPDQLHSCGDDGNLTILKKRMEWRGHTLTIHPISLGETLDPSLYDLIFIGSGENHKMLEIISDFNQKKAASIHEIMHQNKVILAIGNGFHLLGHSYQTARMENIELSHLLDFTIRNDHKRSSGDIVIRDHDGLLLTGFENHRAVVQLGPDLLPFAHTLHGIGNNGTDQTEGVRYRNTFGTHLHSPLLADNPVFADKLLTLALQNKYGQIHLSLLDDSLENEARQCILKRYQINDCT